VESAHADVSDELTFVRQKCRCIARETLADQDSDHKQVLISAITKAKFAYGCSKSLNNFSLYFEASSKHHTLLVSNTDRYQQGYTPVRALIENCVVPENFCLGPQPSPPEPRINQNCQTCNSHSILQYFTIHKIITQNLKKYTTGFMESRLNS